MKPSRKAKAKSYDFVATDPITGMACEVKIIRYCPPDATYSLPLSSECSAALEKTRIIRKLIRYISRI